LLNDPFSKNKREAPVDKPLVTFYYYLKTLKYNAVKVNLDCQPDWMQGAYEISKAYFWVCLWEFPVTINNAVQTLSNLGWHPMQ
jgi:hypothetical protein